MNTVNYKHSPGDHVFGVNFYPSGARIFEGDVIEVFIFITSKYQGISYQLTVWPVNKFPENCVFITREEAEIAVQKHKEKIQHEKDIKSDSTLLTDIVD